MAAEEEKVFVALPAEFKAGQWTLSWALSHFGGGGSTIVIAHVHVPSQMIPMMGAKFHASKLSAEQVSLFRWAERGKVNKMLNDYVRQCSKMKVKCEKLLFEKEDVVAGLIELIASHGVTKLVISAAADKHYSRKMNRPKSRTAIEIMQRADPSCKIWFVCKGQLICTRDMGVEISRAVSSGSSSGHSSLDRSVEEEVKERQVAFGAKRVKPRDETPVIPIKPLPETANSPQTALRPSPPPARMPPTPPEPETDPEFVELDPTGRYGRVPH